MTYTYSGISLSSKKEMITNICNQVDKSQKLNEKKNLDAKEYVMYDSIYMMFSNRQDSSKVKTIWMMVTSVEVRRENWSMREFSAVVEMSVIFI